MDEYVDCLGEATALSTLALSSGYWKNEIDKHNCDKKAFMFLQGLYRFIRMLSGLKTFSATFQRAMNVMPTYVRWQFALMYLDDVAVICKLSLDDTGEIRHVLQLIYAPGLNHKLKKC